MSAEFARTLDRTGREERTESLRMRAVLALGPLTSAAGLGWATVGHQPGSGLFWRGARD